MTSVQVPEDAWLAGVQHSPDRPAVCFKFANYGRCDRLEKNGHCEYSHDPEDIKKFKAAQTLGEQGIRNIAKNLPKQGSQPKLQQRYNKTHLDMPPREPSPGSRPLIKRPPGALGSGRRS